MKMKRHYFYLSLSIVNTIIFATSLTLSMTGFFVSLANGAIQGIVTCGILSLVSIAIGVIYVAFDGWANWRINGETIIVSRLFRMAKTVSISQISSINEKKMEVVFIGAPETLECYEIRSGDIVIKLPKSQAADALAAEIRNRNNI